MVNSVINFKVDSGYKVIRKSKKVDLQTAYEVLESKKQKEYAEAVMSEDHAELVWYVARCPYCGKETSLYKNRDSGVHKHFFSDELAVMTGIQLSFLEKAEDVIYINENVEKEGLYLCKKCCQFSKKEEEKLKIAIAHKNNSLNVFCKVSNVKNLFRLKWIDKVEMNSSFPLYEKICFDFDKGETAVSLEDKEGNIISFKKVTSDIVHENQSPLIEMISKNYSLRRKLLKEFRKHTDCDSSLSFKECNFERFLMMTQFCGFDKSFYNAIPYEEKTYRIDSSFEEVASQFKNPQGAMEMLKKSAIPYVKSVKRIFAGNQGLFFYLKECEKIYDVLKDVNLLCNVLQNERVYEIFIELHNFDGFMQFYRDLCQKEGKVSFCNMMISYYDRMSWCAESYCSMSENMRKKFIDGFDKKKNLEKGIFRCRAGYVAPMKQLPENIEDCTIGDIAFKKLETQKDYIIAGEKLMNCLDSWKCDDNPAVVMLRRGEYVGAIEIGNGEIIDALKTRNDYINRNDELFRVIEKWCKKYNIEWNRLKNKRC